MRYYGFGRVTPYSYEKGFEINMDPTIVQDSDISLRARKLKDGKLVTSGGRVLGVTAVANTLKDALLTRLIKRQKKFRLKMRYYRKDIGLKALNAGEEN